MNLGSVAFHCGPEKVLSTGEQEESFAFPVKIYNQVISMRITPGNSGCVGVLVGLMEKPKFIFCIKVQRSSEQGAGHD